MVHSGTHQEESLYRYECGYVSCENVGDVGIVGSQARCVSSDFFERRCDGGKSTSVGATGRLGSKRCAQITKMLWVSRSVCILVRLFLFFLLMSLSIIIVFYFCPRLHSYVPPYDAIISCLAVLRSPMLEFSVKFWSRTLCYFTPL